MSSFGLMHPHPIKIKIAWCSTRKSIRSMIYMHRGKLQWTCCAQSERAAVLLAPVCERCCGVGRLRGGGGLVEPEPVRESPGLRRGEERGKVSTTACHRQTDDTSTGLHAGDLAVITPHTHTRTCTYTHTHSCMHCYQTD